MNKEKVLLAIVAKLREDLELYHKAAVAARAEATHEQSKAENKYDTRGLEASYLARGQSKQAAELAQAIVQFEKLTPKLFKEMDPIETGALVEVQNGKEVSTYFVGPRSGGTEVMYEGREILVITPESPLGAQLMGKTAGAHYLIEVGGSKQKVKIVSVR